MSGIKQRNILPGIDYNYSEGIKVFAGEAISAGDIVYASGFANDYIQVSKARADQAPTYQASRLLIAKHGMASGEYGIVLPWQMIAMDTHTGGPATIGDKVFLSDTPGAPSLAAGTTSVVIGSVVGVGTLVTDPPGKVVISPESHRNTASAVNIKSFEAEVPIVPNGVVDIRHNVPFACTVTEITFTADDTKPVSALGTFVVTVAAASNNLLAGTNYDLDNTLTAGTLYSASLTTTTAHLSLAKGARIQFAFTSNNADLVGAGLRCQVTYQAS
jgi:hypothetical protein